MKLTGFKILFYLSAYLFLGMSNEMHAQQLPQFSQYMYNTIAINPAFAGSTGSINVMGMHRSQWLGIDGAPTTQFFSVQGPISENMGAGISIINDKLGYEKTAYFNGDLSYTINTNYILK